MVLRRALFYVLLLLLAPCLSLAVEVRQFDTPEQEQRYYTLIEELRCTVCQNQNIADSNAELATDLRRKTYELVRQGKSNREVLDYMVARYGNFVRYSPPLQGGALLLWVAPVVATLLVGGLLFGRIHRNRRRQPPPQGLDQQEVQRTRELLRNKTDLGQ